MLLINSRKALFNVLRNALRPGYAREMLNKLSRRLTGPEIEKQAAEATAWCESIAVCADAWARALDPVLWDEACEFASEQAELSDRLKADLGFDVAGGGFYTLGYFLTRLHKPSYIVETGVAAGHSSRSFLKAIEKNGSGHLWSSDFPLFRLENPERYIGIVVEADLRQKWTLLTKGDRKNLPEIVSEVPQIDLFHFDSDKSEAGREFAWSQILPKVKPGACVVFDDVQDNLHFKRLVESLNADFHVFEFAGKWIGFFQYQPDNAK
jgi:predicted O-methyltransferase YrrM